MFEHALVLLDKAMRTYATDTAVSFEDHDVSFRRLDLLADVAASRLVAAGVSRGHRVALLLGNSPDYLIFDIAIMRVGAVKVPLNPMLTEPEIRHILDHAQPRCIVTNKLLESKLSQVGTDRDRHAQVVSVGRGLFHQAPAAATDFVPDPAAPDDPAVIYYTGGTTGKPKGVVHTHRSVAANLLSHVIEADIRRGEMMLLTTPLSHSAGLFAITGLMMGATVRVHSSFSVEALIDEIDEGKASWTFLVPTMIYRLLDEVSVSRKRLAGLETIVYGASPITPDRLRQALESIDAGFIQLYGQTECPNFATTLDKNEHRRALHDESLRSSCGRASTMTEVQIMTDTHVAESGEIGEVCLRSPYVMSGYLDDRAATAATLVDGWLRTGDVGLLDRRGYLHLKDRKKDMIISGGMNVYPAEVEAAISELEGVSRVAVIGVPHDTWGESVCAFVVAEDGVELSEAAVITFARERLGTYKRPKHVEFVSTLPLTAVGKLDKKALREGFWSHSDRQIQ